MHGSRGTRSIAIAFALMVAVSAPSRAEAQFSAMDDNSALRMGGVLFMAFGGAGFLGSWLGFPFYVQDQHFTPCRASCSDEFGVGFIPLAGPWGVLASSVMVPAEASVAFGLAQVGSLALGILGVIMWGVSLNPQTNQPEFIGLAPMILPGGGGALAMVSLE